MMIRQTSGISLRLKSNVFLATRSLSSPSLNSEAPKVNFAQQRMKYNAELAELRRGWARDIEVKKEREAARQKIERERIVLGQAVRLRQDRIAALITQEKERRKKQIADQSFKQHLANNEVVREKRQIVQQIRFSQMVNDICDEATMWITNENVEQRISSSLFTAPSTTGLVTKSSQHWRYYALIYDFHTGDLTSRNPEFGKIHGPNMKYYRTSKTTKTRAEKKEAYRTSIHRCAELFVEPMIASGEERNRFAEITQRVGDTLEYMDNNQDLEEDETGIKTTNTNWLKKFPDLYAAKHKKTVEIKRSEWVPPHDRGRSQHMANTSQRQRLTYDSGSDNENDESEEKPSYDTDEDEVKSILAKKTTPRGTGRRLPKKR